MDEVYDVIVLGTGLKVSCLVVRSADYTMHETDV